MASQEELEDMEELARIAQDLRNDFGLDLPAGMGRISNISNSSTRIDVRNELSSGLSNCQVVSATNPDNSSRVRYFTVETSVREFCDFEVEGGARSESKTIQGATIVENRQSFEIVRKEGHFSGQKQIDSIEVTASSISKNYTSREIGAISKSSGSKKFKLVINMTDGTAYSLKAMDSGRSRTKRIEDSGRHNKYKTVNEFMAAASMPEGKLTYHWQRIEGSSMDKAEELVRINGLRVKWE